MASRTGKIFVLYLALVRAHLDCCSQFWTPQFRKDLEVLVCVQRKATRFGKGLKHNSYEELMRGLSLEKSRLRGDLIAL